VVQLADRRRRYEVRSGFRADRFLKDLGAIERFRRWGLPEPAVRHKLENDEPRDNADAIRLVYQVYADQQRKDRYGDKTPSYVLHLGQLSHLFPESRFIHLIRDGRDVAMSLSAAAFGPSGIPGAAAHWAHHVSAGSAAGRGLGPGRYLEIRYESLVDDTEGVIERVCQFIDLDYNSNMMRYYERANEVIAGVGRPEQHQHLRLPPQKDLRNWRRDMPVADISSFEEVAGDVLQEFGYERATCVDVDPSGGLTHAGVSGRAWHARAIARRTKRAVRKVHDAIR
jgi:hypothetical protein